MACRSGKMDLGHLICGLLTDAKDKFIHAPQATENLMRIGILLHIFADTYAHQNFSGFGIGKTTAN